MITKVRRSLYRGPQPTWDDLKGIPNLKTVISLEEDFDEDFLGGRKDQFANVNCCYWPLSDFWGPSAFDLNLKASHIEDFEKYGSVYVHCLKGVDRTGLVCAAYRILIQKWTVEAATTEMYNMGFHWWYRALGWPKVLKDMNTRREK